MKDERKARYSIVLSMIIFGTIGLVRKGIPLSSTLVALLRASVGGILLLIYALVRREKVEKAALKRNLRYLIPSSVLLGFNWILLFESYNYTSVAVATLCYYMAPIFLILSAVIFLKERMTLRRSLAVPVALVGMFLVSGGFSLSLEGREIKGVLFGILAAVMYAAIVTLNKKTEGIPSLIRTLFQLLVSALILVPYLLLTEGMPVIAMKAPAWIWLFVLCLVHTGIAYVLYFGAVNRVSAQTAAILSYIDPVLAVLLSALVLKEPLSASAIVGAVLIIGAAVVSELPGKEKK